MLEANEVKVLRKQLTKQKHNKKPTNQRILQYHNQLMSGGKKKKRMGPVCNDNGC